MTTESAYPNGYIASLAKAQQRRGDIQVMPTRDRTNGFVEVPLETDPKPEKLDQAETEICPLSPAQLRDVGAVIATVMEITSDSNFIKLAYYIGHRKRTATGFCVYADKLVQGDMLYVLVRQIGQQQVINILGLVPPGQKEGNT